LELFQFGRQAVSEVLLVARHKRDFPQTTDQHPCLHCFRAEAIEAVVPPHHRVCFPLFIQILQPVPKLAIWQKCKPRFEKTSVVRFL
jgi:hypothetical protein